MLPTISQTSNRVPWFLLKDHVSHYRAKSLYLPFLCFPPTQILFPQTNHCTICFPTCCSGPSFVAKLGIHTLHFHHLFLFKILQIDLFHKNSTRSSEQWWSIPPTEVPKSQPNTLRNAQRWCRLSIFAFCTLCLCLIAHLCFAEQLGFGVCPFTCVFSYKILIIPLVPSRVLNTVFPLTSLKIFVEIHEPRLTPDPLIQTIWLKTTGLR